MNRRAFVRGVVGAAAASGLPLPSRAAAVPSRDEGPIRLHPENPRYFLWRGRPTVLITSGEHYGAVINLDFDYLPYLDELKRHGFNLTRAFSGAYGEVPGSFNITGNTLAPAPGRFLCPWARGSTPGASDGGPKFDLSRWDEAYFARLKDFLTQAGRRGIVVELVLFCVMYNDEVWNASPLNPHNNVNNLGDIARSEVLSLKHPRLVAAQEGLARKLASELRSFDNLYYEICNEPYERGGYESAWNDRIIAALAEAEADLPRPHLIAQNVGIGAHRVVNPHPRVSVLNFHAATPESAALNLGLKRVLAYDESGGADRSDRKYRTEGWEFMMAGGGVFSHLDFSFTTDREDGSAVPLPPGTPGGGGPSLRRQLRILKEFIEGLDFVRMEPDNSVIRGVSHAAPEEGAAAEARPTARALIQPGRVYAVYLKGDGVTGLTLDLPSGRYLAEWLNTKSGRVDRRERFRHGGGERQLAPPAYSEDIALRVRRLGSPSLTPGS